MTFSVVYLMQAVDIGVDAHQVVPAVFGIFLKPVFITIPVFDAGQKIGLTQVFDLS